MGTHLLEPAVGVKRPFLALNFFCVQDLGVSPLGSFVGERFPAPTDMGVAHTGSPLLLGRRSSLLGTCRPTLRGWIMCV